MDVFALDHIVLCVANVERTIAFYRDIVGLQPREERPGKWSLHFGTQKISLQDAKTVPDLAKGTLPGTGNFCLLTTSPISDVVDKLLQNEVEILAGPDERIGAAGTILSVYFHDPDGNLVEVSNLVDE